MNRTDALSCFISSARLLGLVLTLCAPGSSALAAQERAEATRVDALRAIPAVPPEISARYARFERVLQPGAKSWAEGQARTELQRSNIDLRALEFAIRERFRQGADRAHSDASTRPQAGTVGSPADEDIEAMVFIVLTEATNDQNKDLENTMNEAQSETKAKAELRGELEIVNAEMAASANQKPTSPCATPRCASIVQGLGQIQAATASTRHPLRYNVAARITYAQLRQIQQQLQSDLSSTNELSEMQSMRLQMLTDQRSKLVDTLSNVMKKLSDTSDAIVQNMK